MVAGEIGDSLLKKNLKTNAKLNRSVIMIAPIEV
jgi:hypothetical protein